MKKPPIDPFTVRKSRKSKSRSIPPAKTETREERKLRLQQELAAIEAEEQASSLCHVVDRVAELTRITEAAKDAYRELDDLVDQLLESGETSFETSDGQSVVLVDNFSDKNKAWKSVAFQRFSVKLT